MHRLYYMVVSFYEVFQKEIRLRSGSQRKLTCSPLRFNCLTAISILSCDSSDPLIEPLYTHPNPPSPTISERLKFFVALFNSENVKALRLLGLWEKLGYWFLTRDSELKSETFCEFSSEPDRLVSRSVDVVLIERTEEDFIMGSSLLLPPFRKGKHFIAVN